MPAIKSKLTEDGITSVLRSGGKNYVGSTLHIRRLGSGKLEIFIVDKENVTTVTFDPIALMEGDSLRLDGLSIYADVTIDSSY